MNLKAALFSLCFLPFELIAGETTFEFGGPVWMFKPAVPFAAVHGELHFPSDENDCNLLFYVFKGGWKARAFVARPGGFKDQHTDVLRFSVYLTPATETSADRLALRPYNCRLVLQEPKGFSGTTVQDLVIYPDEFDGTTNYYTGRFMDQDFRAGIVPLFYIASHTVGKGPITEPKDPVEILQWHSESSVIVCYLVRDQTTLEWLAPNHEWRVPK